MATTTRRRIGPVRQRRRLGAWALAGLLAAGGVPARGQDPPGAEAGTETGAIVGTVSRDTTHGPLARATLVVEGLGLKTESDGQGRFALSGVRPGTYRLLVSHPCCVTLYRTDVVVTAHRGTPLAVALVDLPQRAESVEVAASAFARPADVAGSWYSANHEEVRRAPGVLGDVSRLAQTFPGVVISNDQRNDIVARGGSPFENLTLVDGFEVANLSHFAAQGTTGGPISMVNTELIEGVGFLVGGFPAAYGDRLSSVLEVSLREGSRERFEAAFTLDTSGAGFVLEGPLTRRGSYLVSARRSFLDLIFEDFGSLTAVPTFSNYQAKVAYDLDGRNRLTILTLGGRDDIHLPVDETDVDDPSLLDVRSAGHRLMAGASLQTLFGERGFGRLTLSAATATYDTDVLDAQIGNQLVVRNRNQEGDATLKYDAHYRVKGLGLLRAGVLVRRLNADYSVEQPIGLRNMFSIDPTRVHQLDLDLDTGTSQASGYVQVSPSLGRLRATLGARYDYLALNQASSVSPRVGLSFEATSRLTLSASYGRFRQVPPLALLTAYPSNAALEPMEATHYVAGLALFPRRDLRISVEGYLKEYARYPVSSEYPTLSLANTGAFYAINPFLLPLVSEGHGRARGLELYVQQKLSAHLYGELSYAYSRTEHAALDGILRRGAFDAPQVLSLIGGYRLNDHLEVSTKLTAASGRPLTPYLQPYSHDQNRPILDLSAWNSLRSPAYRRLDLRFDRRHGWGWGNMNVFLEIQNVLGRENVLEPTWNAKTRSGDWVEQLSRFFVGGVTIEF